LVPQGERSYAKELLNYKKTIKARPRGLTPQLQKALRSGNIDDILAALTGKQRSFVEEYLVDLNGTAAVQRSAYSSDNPAQLASELLKTPSIRAAIDALKMDRAKHSDVTADYVLKKIVATIERCETKEDYNPNAILRGAELLAKHLGMFIERQEITGKDGEAIKYEKVREDADDFTRSIASLVERAGAPRVVELVDPGAESKS